MSTLTGLLGLQWTKTHTGDLGEVYFLVVDPESTCCA
jgi:hypothetical protein